MFIISDLDGNLVQLGTFDTDMEILTLKFQESFNKKLIYTTNEELCLIALRYRKFKLQIENNLIVGIKEIQEEEIIEILVPTLEERLNIAEDMINFLLGL